MEGNHVALEEFVFKTIGVVGSSVVRVIDCEIRIVVGIFVFLTFVGVLPVVIGLVVRSIVALNVNAGSVNRRSILNGVL